MNDLERKIEALLFYENRPVSYTFLAKIFHLTEEELKTKLKAMLHHYEGRGIKLILSDGEVSLLVDSSLKSIIQKMDEEKTRGDLSRQALETLAIILYKGKVSKTEIDYIRGVNSSFILRNLRLRALVDREVRGREHLYFATTQLYAFLGIRKKEDLPDFHILEKKLAEIENSFHQEEGEKEEVLSVQ